MIFHLQNTILHILKLRTTMCKESLSEIKSSGEFFEGKANIQGIMGWGDTHSVNNNSHSWIPLNPNPCLDSQFSYWIYFKSIILILFLRNLPVILCRY